MTKAKPRPSDAGPILVVDDDAAIRHALERVLRREGHRVVTAEDGPTALAASRAEAPCLVVLDFMMPGMDGEAVLHALRDALADAMPPALLLTASDAARGRAEAVGAAAGLGKPFRVGELLDAVDRFRTRVWRESS